MAGLLQNEDHKTEAELVAAGGSKSQLLNDDKLYITANSINETLDDAITGGLIGGGSSGTNYIGNPGAEITAVDWNTYADAAGAAPVDGEGGSPTVTFTRSTSSPLRGAASFLFTKDAANRQGEGATYEYVLDAADLARNQSITFDCKTSANYADGDIRVYIISSSDDFAVDFDVIETVPVELLAGTGKYTANFQTDASDVDYRLCVHVASTNATAYTVKLDNISVGPQVVNFGQPMTEWSAYTPTLSNSTNVSSNSSYYRRVGDTLEVISYLTWNGAGAGATFSISIPSGLSIDYSKLASSSTLNVGTGIWNDNGVGFKSLAVVINSSVSSTSFVFNEIGTANTFDGSQAASGDQFRFYAKVPIVGWGLTAQLADVDSSRVVAASVDTNSSSALATGSTTFIGYGALNFDTNSGFSNVGSSCNTTYTNTTYYIAQDSGYYSISAQIQAQDIDLDADEQLTIGIAINGSNYRSADFDFGGTQTTVRRSPSITDIVYLTKGQIVSVFVYHEAGSNVTLSANDKYSFLSIYKIQGNQQSMAGETVAAKYDTDTLQSIPNNSPVVINFDSKTHGYDTHNSVVTGAAWKFIAPCSGIFSIGCSVRLAASSGWELGESMRIYLYKNTTLVTWLDEYVFTTSAGSGSALTQILNGSTELELDKDDYVQVKIFQESDSSISLYGSEETNWISVKKI